MLGGDDDDDDSEDGSDDDELKRTNLIAFLAFGVIQSFIVKQNRPAKDSSIEKCSSTQRPVAQQGQRSNTAVVRVRAADQRLDSVASRRKSRPVR
jgi:hypothetical protein